MTVSDDVLKAFATLATPTIANALDDVAFEGVMQGPRPGCTRHALHRPRHHRTRDDRQARRSSPPPTSSAI